LVGLYFSLPKKHVKGFEVYGFKNYISSMNIKNYHIILLLLSLIVGCNSFKSTSNGSSITSKTDQKLDTIKIANDSLNYEIIILEVGFNSWLATQRPRGFYTQNFLENRNRVLVAEYNNRVNEPSRFNNQLYPFRIDYDYQTDYGYEVNYLLYHYFLFFQQKFNQKLAF